MERANSAGVARPPQAAAAASLLSGGEPPYVFGSLRGSTAAAGRRRLARVFNASRRTVLTVASAHHRRRVPDAERRGQRRGRRAVPGAARAADSTRRCASSSVGTRDACCSATSAWRPAAPRRRAKALRRWPSGATRAEANGTADRMGQPAEFGNKLCGADCADAGAFTLPSARSTCAPPRPRALLIRRAHRAPRTMRRRRRAVACGPLCPPLWCELQAHARRQA